jgi:predicted phosphoribosyltransferase
VAYADRREAGRTLAAALADVVPEGERRDVIVLGLPRGGVPVAAEVARALGAPLDVFVVRKLGLPGRPELAMGAIATGGTRVVNREVVSALGIEDDAIDAVASSEAVELARRAQVFRGDRPDPDVSGKTVVVVDDGLATGSTMRAAVEALRRQRPARIVVAVPVGAASTCRDLSRLVDDVVCAATPEPFVAVGHGYDDFAQTTDDEVREILVNARRP